MTPLREERDPGFWYDVLQDPVVRQLRGSWFTFEQVAQMMAAADILPLAAEHGGFWFVQYGASGRVYELHTMFTPAGWGREVHGAAKEAFTRMFTVSSCELIVTLELMANAKSQPPRSFGFRPTGGFCESLVGSARHWMLTREAWFASPAGRRQCQ